MDPSHKRRPETMPNETGFAGDETWPGDRAPDCRPWRTRWGPHPFKDPMAILNFPQALQRIGLPFGLALFAFAPGLLASGNPPGTIEIPGEDPEPQALPTPQVWLAQLTNHPDVSPLMALLQQARTQGNTLGVAWGSLVQETPDQTAAQAAFLQAANNVRFAINNLVFAQVAEWDEANPEGQNDTLFLAVAIQGLLNQLCHS
jgi:hypothetical protein